MTLAPDDLPLTAPGDLAAADVTALLPSREALLDRLAGQLTQVDGEPATLIVLGLMRRDDGWPTPQSTLAQVTTLLARSIRGDDWVAACGPCDFGIVLAGAVSAGQTAAARLVAAIIAQGVPGISAAAGIAPVDPDLSAGEVFRRATLSLTAARRVGAGTVIRYREPA
jgi:GGDEF domain-containing protein